MAGFDDFDDLETGMRLGLGCVDPCDRQVESPQQVCARMEEAMRYVDKERITLHPDCGFSPSVQNPMDLDEAYLKLKAMCQAAELLRAPLLKGRRRGRKPARGLLVSSPRS